MAKTVGALMSMEASGKFGGAITFDRRGYARVYKIPANPQTAGQGDVRQRLAAVQAVAKLLSVTAVTAIKAVSVPSYRWNSFVVKNAIGSGSAQYTAALGVWTALSSGEKTSWNGAFATVAVPDNSYATMAAPTSGEAAFIVATGLFAAGLFQATAVPSASNYAAWATALL